VVNFSNVRNVLGVMYESTGKTGTCEHSGPFIQAALCNWRVSSPPLSLGEEHIEHIRHPEGVHMNWQIWFSMAVLFPTLAQAAGNEPIAELYLFPRGRLTADTLSDYQEVVTKPAWAKFDKVCVYGALPDDPPNFDIFKKNVQHLAELHGRELAYQAPTFGSGGWEQYPWTRSDFWSAYGANMPSAFLGVDVESLQLEHSVPPAERAAKVRAYLQEFIKVANAKHAQKDVWYTGSWQHFPWSGNAAPLIFTPDLVAQLDRVHWMDMPKLLTRFGDEAAYRKQVKRLIETVGVAKTYLQVGFLNDMDMAKNAARARRMMGLAQEMGVNRFTIYVKLPAIHDPAFQRFYDELNKQTGKSAKP
jgi:hypothetical protein